MDSHEVKVVQNSAATAPEIAPLIWMMEDARRRTKEALAGLSDVVLNWKPAEESLAHMNSIGSILYHIAAIELDRFNQGQPI